MTGIFIQEQEELEKDAWKILTKNYQKEESEIEKYHKQQEELLRSLE